MQQQMMLFKVNKSYDLSKLRKICRDEIKKKFPSPMPNEEYTDYLTFLSDESDILFAQRLKEIAAEIEERIFGAQKQVIQEVYGVKK